MLIELMFLEATLSRWLRTPDAPICELSLNRTEKRCWPYSVEEIRAMREMMKRYSWHCYIRLFYNEGPFVLPPGAWTHSVCIEAVNYYAEPKVGGKAKVKQLRRRRLAIKIGS